MQISYDTIELLKNKKYAEIIFKDLFFPVPNNRKTNTVRVNKIDISFDPIQRISFIEQFNNGILEILQKQKANKDAATSLLLQSPLWKIGKFNFSDYKLIFDTDTTVDDMGFIITNTSIMPPKVYIYFPYNQIKIIDEVRIQIAFTYELEK